MATNNSINFAHLPTKSAPTTSDIVFISDQAASGAAKQATIGSLPLTSGQLTTENKPFVGLFSPGIPGMFSGIQSDSQTQSLSSTFASNVIFVPFYISQSWSLTQLRFLVITGAAASTCTGGIYAASISGTFNNFPTGAPLTTGSATTAVSATNVIITLSTITLLPNTLYWAAFQSSTGTTLSIAIGQLNIDHANIISQVAASSLWTANILTYTHVYSVGSLPTLTQSSIAITASNYLPILVLE
jgi:hypothetical protein